MLPKFFGEGLDLWACGCEDVLREGKGWVEKYEEDVQQVQMLRQHQIHPKDKAGQRQPLAGCKKKDKKGERRSGFPLESQLTTESLVVCSVSKGYGQ